MLEGLLKGPSTIFGWPKHGTGRGQVALTGELAVQHKL
jgi:hypothetical protein